MVVARGFFAVESPRLVLDRMRSAFLTTARGTTLAASALPGGYDSSTEETAKAMGDCVVDNLVSWFEGRGALNPVT